MKADHQRGTFTLKRVKLIVSATCYDDSLNFLTILDCLFKRVVNLKKKSKICTT